LVLGISEDKGKIEVAFQVLIGIIIWAAEIEKYNSLHLKHQTVMNSIEVLE